MRRDIDALVDREFDVVIIGGGMHGAWIALRCVHAGLRVALVEKHDFAGATSANSLKILHGGLRYLQHLDLRRMRSSIAARREFARRSPHLFEPLGCLLPLQGAGVKSPPVLGIALILNDLVSAARNAGVASAAVLPRGKLISASACRNALSPLTASSAVAGALWWDGLARDTARLSLEPLLESARAGAVVANRVCAERYLIHAGRVQGVVVVDTLTARRFEIRSRVVVNATGPWISDLSSQSGLETGLLPSAWTGGMNIVLRRSLGIDTAVALPLPASEGRRRELFFVPWRGVTMVGTHYQTIASRETLRDPAPRPTIESFVANIAAAAPHAGVSMQDVALVHWGALPLSAPGDDLPAGNPTLLTGTRETGTEGLVLVAAEKLTSAPHLSRRVLARVLAAAGTAQNRAGRAVDAVDRTAAALPVPPEAAARLASRYGADWQRVSRHADSDPDLLDRIAPTCEVRGVEVVHAIREEMALTLEDLVMRRLGLGDRGDPGEEALRACAAIAARDWAWTSADQSRAVEDMKNWFFSNRNGTVHPAPEGSLR